MKSNTGFRVWAVLAASAVTALLVTPGCVAAGAGAGVAYMSCDPDATLGVGLDPSIRATGQAVQ